MAQNRKGVTDTAGEAASASGGAVVGATTGAVVGSMVGPIGTIVGGLAGAVGGWWSGRALAEASSSYTEDDDRYYQSHFESSSASGAARDGYESTRPAYQLGHLAGRNPDYRGRSFDEVEPHLSTAYQSTGQDWDRVRDYARNAYSRGQDAGEVGLRASSPTTSGASLSDEPRDLQGGRGLADRTADALDDFKDRVDGNPASRPGRDATDRPSR